MKIGVISEVYGGITTPPKNYGGISASVHNLTEALIARGHDVTLFAPAGSWTSGRLVVVAGGDAPSNDGSKMPPYVYDCMAEVGNIDVWIDGSHHKRFARYCKEYEPWVPILCPSWNPNKADLPQNTVCQSPHMPSVIGDMPDDTPWMFAGIPSEQYSTSEGPYGPAVSINVIAPYKGIDLLVRAAAKYNIPLVLYGHCPSQKWYDQAVGPYVDKSDNIEYKGLIGNERIDILAHAVASFTLANWPEPGSRVSIESFASGCPVIATKCGCFPYYIEDGINGSLVDQNEESVYNGWRQVIDSGDAMRKAARMTAETKFDMEHWVSGWETLMQRVIGGERWE